MQNTQNEINKSENNKTIAEMTYDLTVPQFSKMLTNLKNILGKAANYSEMKKFDMEVLLNARLAPDQFNLLRQIQIACDTAKLGASRLASKEAPIHDDKELTWPQMKTRIEDVVNYLNQLTVADFKACESKKISHPRWEGKWLTGYEFTVQHVVPNFYFHMTTAYSIIRHNGVDIGKKDYLGEMPFKNN